MKKEYNDKCPVCKGLVGPEADHWDYPFDDIIMIAEHLKTVHFLSLSHATNRAGIMCYFRDKTKTMIEN